MDKTKIKNFVFDLDGTLLTSKKQFTPRTLKAINELSTRGNNIIVATGRAYYLNSHIENLVKITHPMISSNGSLIYDFKTKQLLKKYCIDNTLSRKILDILFKDKIDFLIYTADTMVISIINDANPWLSRYKKIKTDLDPTFNGKPGILVDEYLKDIEKFEVSKFLIFTYGFSSEKIEELSTKITNLNPDIYAVSSEGGMLDIMIKEATKGKALEFIAKSNGINLDETLVFGDADNDVSMFKVVKNTVAMGNAVKQLKDIASHITLTNDEEGVATFLEENFLK